MTHVHGLGALQMRVAGHRPVQVLLGSQQQRRHHTRDRHLRLHRLVSHVQLQVGDHLVVARAGGVQPAPDRPGDLGEASLDRHVDVLVVLGELEAALAQLAFHLLQAGKQRVAILGADDRAVGEHPRVRARLPDVVRPQAPVESDRGVQALKVGVLRLTEAGHGRSV